jgi:CBS domain-containing protein
MNNKVKEYFNEDFDKVREDEKLSVALQKLKEVGVSALVVVDKEDVLTGIIAKPQLRRSRVESSKTNVKKLAIQAPSISVNEDISEAARLMIESQSPILPVYAGEKLKGVIAIDDLLEPIVSEELGKIKIKQMMTEDPLTVRPFDSIARVLDLFNSYGISHAPVADNGKLVGIVSISDILDIMYKDRMRQEGGFAGVGERKGEKSSLMHMETKSVMSSPVIAAKPDDSLQHAWTRMKENDITSLIIMKNGIIVGILTKRDLLQPIAQTGMIQRRVTLQFSIKPGIRITEQEKVVMQKGFDSFVRKYKDTVGKAVLFIYLKGIGAVSKGDQLVQCRLQMRTSNRQYYSAAEAWSTEEAYSLALERLTRRIIQHKDTKLDDEYSKRQIQKLLESEEF